MGNLLERDDELRLIDRALDAALRGRVGAAVVLGSPGIGKSALLEETMERAKDHGFQVRTSAFTPISGSGVASLLWDLFPEAASADAGRESFDGPARHLLRAVRREEAVTDTEALAYGARWAVTRLAEARPQLIAVDDLHWADAESLQLLVSLALRLRGARVALVLTARPNREAEGTLAALLAAPDTVPLEPQPLSASGIAELAARLAPDGPGADGLSERSGGNPFYARAILESADGSPTRLVSSVRVRLSGLKPRARDAAEALAVAGGALQFSVLGSALGPGADHAQLRSALAELEAACLVASSDGALRISPPVVAQAIVAGLTAERRSELHERIAAAMHGEGLPLAVIAPHEMRAQPSGDRRRVAVLIEMARAAEAAGTPAAAAQAYARARGEGGLDGPTRIELTLAEGRARTVAGDGEAGLALIGEVVQGIPDPLARGRHWAELGDLAYMAGRTDASAAAYEHARTALEGEGDASEEARLVLAKILATEGTLRTEIWDTLRNAAEAAANREDGAPDRADAAFAAVVALAQVLTEGPSPSLARLASRALAAGLDAGAGDDPITYVLSGALGDLAMIDEAEQLLGAALADAQQRGSIFGSAAASYARGALRLRFGRVRAGLADLEASWSGIGLGWHTYFYPMRHYLALALLRTGERERAIEVAGTPPRGRDSAFPLIGRMTELVLALETGDDEAAIRHADALLGVRNPFVHAGIEWRPRMAEAYLRRGGPGDAERARLLIRAALDELSGHALPVDRAAILLEAAGLSAADEAEALYGQILELVGDDPVYEAAAARIALARFAVARGEVDRAREQVRLGLDYAMREGARPLSTAAYDLLMLIDPSPSLIDADERLARLSASELRIAAAAASGLNNRQIAQEHFVTMRTVEFHLTNVYRKLSISGREELRRIIPALPTHQHRA